MVPSSIAHFTGGGYVPMASGYDNLKIYDSNLRKIVQRKLTKIALKPHHKADKKLSKIIEVFGAFAIFSEERFAPLAYKAWRSLKESPLSDSAITVTSGRMIPFVNAWLYKDKVVIDMNYVLRSVNYDIISAENMLARLLSLQSVYSTPRSQLEFISHKGTVKAKYNASNNTWLLINGKENSIRDFAELVSIAEVTLCSPLSQEYCD